MSPYMLLTVLAIAASAASETTTKTTSDFTTKRPGIQPLPAALPGSATLPSHVRDTRQIVTTTPKIRPLTDSLKNVPSTTPGDITATPTFPRRRRDNEDEDEKTLPFGNQRPLFGGAFGQLFAARPNFGLPNLFGNRRPALDQGVSDLTIQSQIVPAAGLQTFGATQTVNLSDQPEKLTAAQSTSQLASQSATLTGSQSTDQPSSSSTTVTTNPLSEATSTSTTHSNDGQTSQSSTESSRKTREVETESPLPKSKSDANEDGFKPTTSWTTASTEFKPYALVGNLRTTEKPLGIFSQTSITGNGGSASAFGSASSTPNGGGTHATAALDKDSAVDGWNQPSTTARPFKRDSFQQREKRGADQSTQKPQTGSVLSGSTKPLPTTTNKPQYTRTSQTSAKSNQKGSSLSTTTPKSRAAYPTTSPARPTRSAVTDSPQKTTKNVPTSTVTPSKRDAGKTTAKPTTAPKRTARDTKSSSTTQKPQSSNKKVSN